MTGTAARTEVFGAVTPATLLGDDHDTFGAVLSGETPGPLAVVGPPYSGRERVLDAAADCLDATRVRLDPGDGAASAVGAVGDGPAVVGGCHHLYERRVGGFEGLESFLDAVAEAETPTVTGWNATAWAYLCAVRDVRRAIPASVEVGPVAATDMAAVIAPAVPGLAYRRDDPDRGGLVVVERRPLSWRGRELSVPVPGIDPAAVSALRADDDRPPVDLVFERLARLTGGNLGVGAAVLDRYEGTVAPSDVEPAGAGLAFDGEEVFSLRVLLGAERVRRESLSRVVGGATTRILGRFAREGLVTADAGQVALSPAAVPTVAAAVEREGVL